MNTDNPILQIKNLTVDIGAKRVISNVSFELYPGQVLALVGESGSGKTLTALSVLDLLPDAAVRAEGSILYKGKDIFSLEPEEMRRIRGRNIAMVFQEPFTALNPVMRIGVQISEVITCHKICRSSEITARVEKLLEMVKLPVETRRHYPHELSGGMRQRVVLAMALACDPEVLILDEPTTALDVSIQKEILDLVGNIRDRAGFTILFITHDFSIVNMIADKVCVMKDGGIVEIGDKDDVLREPVDAYTRQLISCIPRLGDTRRRLPVDSHKE